MKRLLILLLFFLTGSSAYSGAMQNLVTPEILTLAAAILATEARQVSWVDSSVTNNVPWGGPFEASLLF